MSRVVPAIVDLVLVVVFAAIGRRSHAEGVTASGVATTAWPFLVGAAGGWLVATVATDLAPRSMAYGVVVVVAAVVIGMLLRQATGQGTAWAFVAVAAVSLTVLLLGWRLLARLVG